MSLFKDFAGKATDMYRDYWDRKNQELREQARAAHYNDLVECTRDEYYRMSELLMESVNNTAAATHLRPVTDPMQIYHSPGVVEINDGVWGFRYRGHRYQDNNLTAGDVTRILQREMKQFCANAGWPQVILKVRFGPDGTILIDVVYAADAHRYRQHHPRG